MYFLAHRERSGVYNCGTGRAQSFNEIAVAVINEAGGTQHTLAEIVSRGMIEYIPFPPGLQEKYQSFTEADLGQLRGAGYAGEFMDVGRGVGAYVRELMRT